MLALAACGGGDDSADAPVPTEPAEPPAAATADCPATQLAFTNHETGTSGTATAALATADRMGSPYLAYAADHASEPSAVSSFYPTVPAGGNVVLVQFTTLSGEPAPYEPGMQLEWGQPGPTFLVIHVEGDQRFQTADEGQTSGTLTVTAAAADVLCFEVDYRDGTVEVAGTVAAPIVGP